MSITQNTPIHLCIYPHGVYTHACASIYMNVYVRLTSLAKNQIMLPPCRLQSHLESSTCCCCCCCSFLLLVAVVVFDSLFYRFVVAVSIGRLCLGSSASVILYKYFLYFVRFFTEQLLFLLHSLNTSPAHSNCLSSYSYSYFILLLLSVIIQFAVAAQFY